MRKVLASLLVLFVLMISVPLSAEAHSSCPRHRRAKRTTATRNYRARTVQPQYYATQGYTYKRPSFYRRHRNLINIGAATGGGALLGALFGGKRGAGIGALVGAGSGALYTYKIRPKRRVY